MEKVYENALKYELELNGLKVTQQYPISVYYKGKNIGDYYADLVVNDFVAIELKTIKAITEPQVMQCLNYLRATNFPTCLLLNFGNPKVEVRRLDKPISK